MRLPLLLLALVALPACGPATPTDHEHPDGGTHETRVTGATVLTPTLDEAITGRALFASVGVGLPSGGTAQRVVVELQDPGPDPFLIVDLRFASAAPPAAGAYAADAPPEGAPGAVHVSVVQGQSAPSYTEFFEGEAGTVTLTEVSAGRIRGTLDVSARTAGTGAPSGSTVRLRGSFTAVAGRL